MTIGDNGRLDCRQYNSGESFDEIEKLKKANEVLVDSITEINERFQKMLICVSGIEQKLENVVVDVESKYDELQSNISELRDSDVSAADFGFPEIKPNLFDFPPPPPKSALSKCDAKVFVEIAQRLEMLEGALKGMNEVDFGPGLEDFDSSMGDLGDFEDEGSAEAFTDFDMFAPKVKEKSKEEMAAQAFGVDMSPEFAKMFSQLPKFNDLVDPISGTTNEQDITVRYLIAKEFMQPNEKLFDVVVELVAELERERRGD